MHDETYFRLKRHLDTVERRLTKLKDNYDGNPSDSLLDDIFYWEQRKRELQDELSGY